MEDKFTFMGAEMPNFATAYGIFLIVWATFFSIVFESESITSWIPAMIGAPILISGLLAKINSTRSKLWMHIAVIFGLFAFLGGLDFFRGFAADGGPFANVVAGTSKLMLAVTGAIFVLGCVKSFIWARKTRTE